MKKFKRLKKSFLKKLGVWLCSADTNSEVMRITHLSEFQYSIAHTKLISSWGFMYACDLFAPFPHNERSYSIFFEKLKSDLALRSQETLVIYLKPEYLNDFALQILPIIETNFVIVSGDSDYSVGGQYQRAINLLIDHTLCVHIYAQNLKIKHKKISCLPIGLDYHTFWQNPNLWSANILMPIHQELDLISILSESPQIFNRNNLIYCNWHFQIHRGDRQNCYENLPSLLCAYEASPISRDQTWKKQSQYTFIASPEGNGLDCHRTWEGIFLGCIPIVKKNSLSDMYKDLPVIVVEDWSSITSDFLNKEKEIMLRKKFDFSLLFRAFWKSKFKGRNPSFLTSMTIIEFRNYLTFYECH